METEESPLDVLSRAATMVQETQALSCSSSSSSDSDTAKTNNATASQRQTNKWKRDRRTPRLPEYSRKSDAKYPETSDVADGATRQTLPPPPSASSNGHHHHEAPLDMSVRQRGEPPSYAQTISNPGYRSSYRPSVIHNNGAPQGAREELPLGISMCDPIIDEHFRRSLGSDYHAIFQNNNVAKEAATHQQAPPRQSPPSPPLPRTPPNTTPLTPTTNHVIELMDSAGLSVDEHFAKALGDTWAKLNNRKDLKRDSGAKKNLVTI